MTDLVKRLREYAESPGFHPELIMEAANEIERLRAGGCARDQTTTQFCAEAQALSQEVARLRRQIANLDGELWRSEPECPERAQYCSPVEELLKP